MEVDFGRRAPSSLGVEEEFQIVHGESHELVSGFDALKEALGEEERVKPELMRSTVEIATEVHGTVAAALDDLRTMRARLRDAAAAAGTRILSAGTHPFSR